MAAEAAVSSVIELLGNVLIEKVKSLQGVEGKVELLKEELKRMQSFLKDANKKQFEDERVRNWISNIREVAQDAEDTIEMFLLNVEIAKNMSLFRRCTTFSKRMYHLDTIGGEIESITARLDAVDKSRERYGIKDLGETRESAPRSEVEGRRRLCPWQKDEHLVGLEEDVKKLLQESILNEEKKGLSIAVLEGMGGIGKSTLAREIYNHPNVVGGPFDRRGWVVVSSEFTPQETIKQLILEVSGKGKQKLLEEMKILEETMKDKQYLQNQLNGMLHKELEGKSYFLVLDDVWKKDHLESLITAFPTRQDKACRLLVTTRNNITTKYNQYVHTMKLLAEKEGWELLLKKAFIGKCPDELESIGRQILQKCNGLPLAISVVGGLLAETQTKSGWEKVVNQMNSYLGTAEGMVLSILELSYYNLSPQLKSCFLWLAFFKEDSIIPTERLVTIWDEQGLIEEEGRRTIDEIGRGYLNDLINRSMVQVQDLMFDGRVENCRLHDLVREVCLKRAKEEIGLQIVKREEGISSESSHKPRHRVVYGKTVETSSTNLNKHLRSLFILNLQSDEYINIPSHYWKSYQLLKTLELSYVRMRRLPDSFRSLVGLKFLKIYGNVDILRLPRWLDHLRNIEIIDLGKGIVEFPRLVSLEMDRLRCFSADIILRGPMKINMWKSIESLKNISHNDWVRCASTLTSGCPLRKLGINLFKVRKPQELMKVRASLEKLQNLVILSLFVGRSLDIALAMPQLPNLTKLTLRGMLPKCPDVSMLPPNLSHLTLSETYLHDDPMAELGKLPNLSFLKIQTNAYMGVTMQVLYDGFPCLEVLILDYLPLKSIFIEEGGMPHLKHLRISICPLLETGNLPEHINIIQAE